MAYIRKRTGKTGVSYQITVSTGYKNKKKCFESVTWRPDPERTERQNEKALQMFAAEFERKVLSGKYLDGEKITFSDFADRWIVDYAAVNMTAASLANTKRLLKLHINPEIGYLKLAQIRPPHLNKLYRTLADTRKDGKPGGYPTSTIRRIHSAVSSIFTQAVLWNVIQDNPCKRVRLPKQDKAVDQDAYFTLEQSDLFLDLLDKEFSYQVRNPNVKNEYARSGSISLQLKLFYYIAIYCGLRRGEIVALLWNNIDFEKGMIRIDRQTTLADGKMIDGKPKKKSIRTITAPDEVLQLAKKWKKAQLEYKLSIGDQWRGSDEYIFITWNGLQMRPETPYKAFKRIIARYNDSCENEADFLPNIALHGLRHTNATLQISEKVDPETVSKRLGHAKTSTTLDVYAHALEVKDQEAAAALSSILKRKKG